MHLMRTVTDKPEMVEEACKSSFGPQMSEDVVRKADRLEIWGSSFSDPGPDFCEFRLYLCNQLIATGNVAGY